MKYFVQYYELAWQCINGDWKRNDIKSGGKYIEPCGDRSVLILDGRTNLSTMIQDAKDNNGQRRPLYAAFQIFKGSFLNATPITQIIEL